MADDTTKINDSIRAHAASFAAPQRMADATEPDSEELETSDGGTPATRDDHKDEQTAHAAACTDGKDAPAVELPSRGIDDPLATVMRKIDDGVDGILAAFEAKLAYDATKQAQIDRLHEELLQHRSDLIARTARPLVHGMIKLHDDMGKLLAALRTKSADELTPERFFSLLGGLQEDVEILLSQNGVAAYREPSSPFDPRRQRVLKKVSTSEESLAGTVAESLRPGFERGAEILEKERVATYVFVHSLPETLGADSDDAPEGNESSPEAQEKED